MTIVLYFGSGSPFAWRVMLALEHKGLAYEARRLSFDRQETRSAEFLAINPRGRVPTLVHDGWPLRESLVILEYLEDAFPAPALLPTAPRARAHARLLARETDEFVGPLIARVMRQTLMRKGEPDPAELAAATAELARELQRLEDGLTGEWLVERLGLADFAVYSQLRMVRRVGERMPEHSLDHLLGPRLAAWMARIEALPYHARTIPPHWKQ